MADNVLIDTGNDVSVSTDDVGGQHYQRIKLTDGTDGSSAAISGDSTWGLDVDVTRIAYTGIYVTGGLTTQDLASTSTNIISAPGAGNFLSVEHLSINNHGNDDTEFKIRNGSGGTVMRHLTVAHDGGWGEINLKRPLRLSTNTALYYEYISGTSPNISITVHYEILS